jgi:hypothetical protein
VSVASAAALGSAGALAPRVLLRRILLRLRRDLSAINAGDHRPLLSGYSHNAVVRFTDGDHRCAGEHRGREAIDASCRNFVAAGMQDEIRELFLHGPPWRLTLIVRFDDHAAGPGGEALYSNRIVLLHPKPIGTHRGARGLYEDTERIRTFEERLQELDVKAA